MSADARVGLVVVSHSRHLAEATVALAMQMVADDPPPVAVAAGTDDGGTGTDATAVMAAVEQVGGPGGVLVVMDLGSAVLSAELALELLGDPGFEVRLSPGPFVEGVVTAVVQAAGGADLAEVAREVAAAGHDKGVHLGGTEAPDGPDGPDPAEVAGTAVVAEAEVVNAHGLHARPAAAVVAAARRHDADVRVSDLTTGRGPVAARSLLGLQVLGAVRGHVLRFEGTGEGARELVEELVAAVRAGFGEGAGSAAVEASAAGRNAARPVEEPQAPGALRGVPASPGRGHGPVWFADELPALPASAAGSPGAEQDRLDAAVAEVADRLERRVAASTGQHREVLQAHRLLLQDEALLGPATAAVAGGADAAVAWQQAVDAVVSAFEGLDEEYLAARASDVAAVGAQVRRVLAGAAPGLRPRPGVLVVDDLAPDDVHLLAPDVVRAVVTVRGSATSHAAILARAAGLPLVVAAGPAVLQLAGGSVLAVDGGTGELAPEPGEELLRGWQAQTASEDLARTEALRRAHDPADTLDGVRVHVAANAAGVQDAQEAARQGADGIGLLRTELVFHGRDEAPDDEEQTAQYLAAAQALDGARLVVRTMDVGGDKPVPYADQPEEANPFLGLRGVRLSLARPALFAAQLRAVVRTALQAPVGVMFPMVATVDELVRARAALLAAAREVGVADGLPAGLEVGIMVEVPAAALRAQHLGRLVDFVSIGTNDLTQYTLAAERGNSHVAGLGDALDPAVLALVDLVCRQVGPRVRVAVCGEVAADPLAAAVLVGLGVRELSVSPRSVPGTKEHVRALDTRETADLARRCLEQPDAAGVRRLLAGGG
ncbi:phosphoenolpyruvate--protein phosphotransferase [Aquipuribacter sp. MA13-6]|uniref:phosphoenolpyruvate--protein phosphotransferase n=1 Tax=unclassified Aquipuribacter TaxID=2635084 RepID=UPI003EEA00B7